MTIDCDGSVGLTQMAGSSALSPLVRTGTVSPSALTRMGAALAGDWNPPATTSVQSTPTPNLESNRRLITLAPFVITVWPRPDRDVFHASAHKPFSVRAGGRHHRHGRQP